MEEGGEPEETREEKVYKRFLKSFRTMDSSVEGEANAAFHWTKKHLKELNLKFRV